MENHREISHSHRTTNAPTVSIDVLAAHFSIHLVFIRMGHCGQSAAHSRTHEQINLITELAGHSNTSPNVRPLSVLCACVCVRVDSLDV